MPIVDSTRLDWAKDIDDNVETEVENGFKKTIEFKYEDDKKFKITSLFKVDRVKLPRTVVERKKLSKFGDASSDPPGVNPATTIVGDEVLMQFLNNKEESMKEEPQSAQIPKIQCRLCKGDHWTTKCPLKDIYEKMNNMDMGKSDATDSGRKTDRNEPASSSSEAYRPPSLRNSGANPQGGVAPPSGTGSGGGRGKYNDSGKDEFTIRVTNLPEETAENDLVELFNPFGKVNRIFLAKDKNTQASRGFAFVNFQRKEDAQRAIWGVNDFGYHHLILKVEWAKPSKE